MSHLAVFERSLVKSERWLDELAAELGTDDQQCAYVVLRATLHALRDRLAVDEAADLAAQLPLVLRGLFFEGWNPSVTPIRIRHRDEFLAPVAKALFAESTAEVEPAARAALGLLARHVTWGEIEDVIRSLPGELRTLFPAGAVARSDRFALDTVHR